MGRTPKYDWSDKRDICHKLHVEQKLPAPKIVEYFANHFKLPESELPAARDFQRQFKKWDFPDRIRKLNPDEEVTLKERMRELFKLNIRAEEIFEKLNEEGWDLDDYRFNSLRKRFGVMYRAVDKSYGSNATPKKPKRAGAGAERDVDAEGDDEAENQMDEHVSTQPTLPPLPPEEEARRAQLRIDQQLESDQRLQTKKRRRRIRGIGHLAPDAPGSAPRYGSETSIDECKAYLHLTNDVYTQIRAQFESICREMGIIKMSLCQEGQWQEAKNRLVRENMHLSSVLHPLQPEIDKRTNALNCICTDVTKRMRDMQKNLTIADASNLLALDPMQSKEVRRVFYEILAADRFTTVFGCGKDHYEELQQQWHAKVPVLQQAMASEDPLRLKAVIVLTKDARKRYCDDQVKKNPGARRVLPQKGYGPGPGPAPYPGNKKKQPNERGATAMEAATAASATALTPSRPQTNRPPRTLIPLGPAWEGQEIPRHRMSTLFDLAGPDINFDLDPLLTRTTHGPPWPPPMAGSTEVDAVPDPTIRPAPPAASIAAYFRLAPDSHVIGHHPRMWLGKLAGANMGELRTAATAKAGAVGLTKINGVVKNADGTEDSWLIENDNELEVYLGEAGEKATFVVLLEGGYA